MITPDEAMEQAHATARKYAYEGIKAFEELTGLKPNNNPQALATFVAGFMQAASTDFAAWAIQNRLEGIHGTQSDGFEDIVSLMAQQG